MATCVQLLTASHSDKRKSSAVVVRGDRGL